MSKDIVDFVTYCIGNLARRLNLSAGEVYRMLKDSGILSEYIVPSYDVLHTFSKEYLMEDLAEYMREKGVLIFMKQPHDEAYHAILEAKYSRIISEISEMHDVSIEQAMEIFYTSESLPLLEDGVADLHCRSDKYLAEEIWREFCEKK